MCGYAGNAKNRDLKARQAGLDLIPSSGGSPWEPVARLPKPRRPSPLDSKHGEGKNISPRRDGRFLRRMSQMKRPARSPHQAPPS
jgi:hypothetical protein